jgi:hypothetical protein
MLEEIRRFFDEQRGPPPKWPEHLPAISPITGEDLRAESEKHWRLAMDCIDEFERRVMLVYEAGANEPRAIDYFDQVMAIVRRKNESHRERSLAIGRLLKDIV